MQRAMSSAQKAKITQLQEQNAQLEARIVELNASLAEARTTADAERQSREELRREAEKFEAHVNDAIESREAQWGAANAHAVNEVRAELKAAKELTRKMHVAHAAAKLRWAAERAHIIHSRRDGTPPGTRGRGLCPLPGRARGGSRAFRRRGFDPFGRRTPPTRGRSPRRLRRRPAPGTALHALLAATTRFSTDARRTGRPSDETAGGETAGDETAHDDPLRELLRDAMEEEVAAAIERGYHRRRRRTIVVGANEIVEAIVAKYSELGDDGDGARGGGDGTRGAGTGSRHPRGRRAIRAGSAATNPPKPRRRFIRRRARRVAGGEGVARRRAGARPRRGGRGGHAGAALTAGTARRARERRG